MAAYDIPEGEPGLRTFAKQETITRPDGYGKNTGECGDTVEIFITARERRIQHIQYVTDGCTATHLCAAAVVQLTQDREIDHAWEIRPNHIVALLEGLGPDHHHCAELAAGALYRALVDLQNSLCKPWAKLYRTDVSGRRHVI